VPLEIYIARSDGCQYSTDVCQLVTDVSIKATGKQTFSGDFFPGLKKFFAGASLLSTRLPVICIIPLK